MIDNFELLNVLEAVLASTERPLEAGGSVLGDEAYELVRDALHRGRDLPDPITPTVEDEMEAIRLYEKFRTNVEAGNDWGMDPAADWDKPADQSDSDAKSLRFMTAYRTGAPEKPIATADFRTAGVLQFGDELCIVPTFNTD